jgi:hypothetical protein
MAKSLGVRKTLRRSRTAAGRFSQRIAPHASMQLHETRNDFAARDARVVNGHVSSDLQGLTRFSTV